MGGCNKLHWDVLMPTGEPERALPMSILKKTMQEGIMPLHVACINPNTAPLKKLLNVSPAYDAADNEGYKPVHYAAVCVSEEPLKLLISKRIVNMNSGSNQLITPLMIACKNGREKNAKLILDEAKQIKDEIMKDKGKGLNDVDTRSFDYANSISKFKETPAYFAAYYGSLKILKLLFDAKANFEVITSKGKTPLMIAASFGHFDCVKYLVEEVKVNPLVRNKKGKTAIVYAIINGQLHVVSYLLRIGMSPNG